jgi:MFS family permease
LIKILSRIADDFRNPITIRIGITATIGYGTLYYSLAVFAPVISLEFGVSIDVFFAIFAVGLFLGGLFAPLVGQRIDRVGARRVMTAGSVVAAAALLLMSAAPNLWTFAAAIIVLEVAGTMVLYEAAFAGLTQIYRQDARRHITSVTLIGGFASTVFWPVTQMLVSEFGWRETCLFFAALHLVICVPLHWKSLARARPVQVKNLDFPSEITAENVLLGPARRRAIWLYGFAICVSGITFAAIPVHILLILQSEGVAARSAALVAMVIGPAQVVARLVEMTAESRFTSLMTGRICLSALPVSFLVLMIPGGTVWTAILFAILYGISQGLSNIVRGKVPLHLFGSEGFGTLVGRITGIRFALNAGAPFAFAFLVTVASIHSALWFGLILALAGALAFWQLRSPKQLGQG